MKCRIILFSIMLVIFVSTGTNLLFGQLPSPQNKAPDKQSNKKRFNIYYHLGNIELPEGYKGYYREGFTDAWYGWIESPDGKFKIKWSAGLVESLFEKYQKDFEWTKTETTPKYTIKYGLMRDKNNEFLAASIVEREIQFIATIKEEKEKDIFMEIIRSYQKERCEVCRTFPFKSGTNK